MMIIFECLSHHFPRTPLKPSPNINLSHHWLLLFWASKSSCEHNFWNTHCWVLSTFLTCSIYSPNTFKVSSSPNKTPVLLSDWEWKIIYYYPLPPDHHRMACLGPSHSGWNYLFGSDSLSRGTHWAAGAPEVCWKSKWRCWKEGAEHLHRNQAEWGAPPWASPATPPCLRINLGISVMKERTVVLYIYFNMT